MPFTHYVAVSGAVLFTLLALLLLRLLSMTHLPLSSLTLAVRLVHLNMTGARAANAILTPCGPTRKPIRKRPTGE